jgi:radical SAM/Cys-rich protein
MNDFDQSLQQAGNNMLHADGIETIQVNVGRRCNLTCSHCYLDCGPGRDEVMSRQVMEMVVAAVRQVSPDRVDITGGAPELNRDLPMFIDALRREGHQAQLRTNLTAMMLPGCVPLAELFRDSGVKLVASLPHYTEVEVDAQRGHGVFQQSIKVLRRLNKMGYGIEPGLELDLVHNPGNGSLPVSQSELEERYADVLERDYGVRFNRLLTITNMPIGRFLNSMSRMKQEACYQQRLHDSFNPCTLESLMCRRQISIRWDGTIFDCDFNLALGTPVDHGVSSSLDRLDARMLGQRRIVTGSHCFGCTAGSGSSCGGTLAKDCGV